jgi:hypothetical protein
MRADSLVIITVDGSYHQVAVYHPNMPEVRAEAGCREAAIDRLAEHVARDHDFVSDNFHSNVIRRALADVDRARSGRCGLIRGASR